MVDNEAVDREFVEKLLCISERLSTLNNDILAFAHKFISQKMGIDLEEEE